jgi:pimeloyl-ACP methyl ester carboxylesterase
VADELPVGFLSNKQSVVLLIHGYNVDMAGACSAYSQFLSSSNESFVAKCATAYWPGDGVLKMKVPRRALGAINWIYSAASYPAQVDRAKRTAQRIEMVVAKSLRARTEPLTLSIVAHSLGCRVALELLRLLDAAYEAGWLRVNHVLLMAAAVPVYYLQQDREYSKAIDLPDDVSIFYSKRDIVLKYGFRPGQALERPFPAGWSIAERSAVGRVGLGIESPRHVRQFEVSHNHGDYWADRAIARHAQENTSVSIGSKLTGRSRSKGILERRELPSRKLQYRNT